MKRILFDIETNGLLSKRGRDGEPVKPPDTVHCICILDLDAPAQVFRYHDQPDVASREGTIAEALQIIQGAELQVGHNILAYDRRVLELLYPGWTPGTGEVFDTLVCSHLMYPHVGGPDSGRAKKGLHPKKLIGYHSLEAWGYRLSMQKGTFEASEEEQRWEVFTAGMLEYCARDVVVNARLHELLASQNYPDECVQKEHEFANYIDRQIQNGVGFDFDAARTLAGKLKAREAELRPMLAEKLGVLHKVWSSPKVQGPKVKTTSVDPGSREQVARALIENFGWEPSPTELTKSVRSWGAVPKMKEETLSGILPSQVPFRDDLIDWFCITQRLGMLTEGDQSFVDNAMFDEDLSQHRIYGHVNHNGARTGRCTHSKPNVNVPRVTSRYGKEMRALFVPRPGWDMVGADLSGVEARMAGHFLAPLDGGAFAKFAVEGQVHLRNQKACGFRTKQAAKNCLYARLYGAQGPTMALTAQKAEGRPYTVEDGWEIHATLGRVIPGLDTLQSLMLEAWSEKRFIWGLDGRRIYPSGKQAVLNAAFQSAGGVLMKRASVIAMRNLDAEVGPENWAPMLHVHDELQIECHGHYASVAERVITEAMTAAGEELNLRVPIAGEASTGVSWAETH